MSPPLADLHIHTNYSDGTFTPDEVMALAKKVGLSCISITDHDSVESLPFFFSHELSKDLEVIPGIELTAEVHNTEVHILGYLLDYKEVWFQEKLKEIRQIRIERINAMCRKLSKLGMPFAEGEVEDFAGHPCVGRLHLARLMLRKGFVGSTQEAFNRYIGDSCSAYVCGFRLSPKEAIELILSVKGVPVLAHPYVLAEQDLIPKFVKLGLMGIEAIYPEHSPAQIKSYKELAREYNLLITGGSDCHGQAKPEVKMGTVMVSYELVQKLKEAKPI